MICRIPIMANSILPIEARRLPTNILNIVPPIAPAPAVIPTTLATFLTGKASAITTQIVYNQLKHMIAMRLNIVTIRPIRREKLMASHVLMYGVKIHSGAMIDMLIIMIFLALRAG